MQKKYIAAWVLLSCIIWFFLYSKYFGNTASVTNTQETYSVVTVEKKDFSSAIDLSGITKIKNEQKLRFNTAGKVVDVYVNAGQEVKKWQPIAVIDSSTALSDIEKSQLNLQSARVKLQKFLDNLEDSGVKNAQLNIDIKKSEIKQKEIELEYLESKQSHDLQQKQVELKQSANQHKILAQEVNKNIASYELTDEKKAEIVKEKQLELAKLESAYESFLQNYDSTLQKNINEYKNILETQYFTVQSNLSNFDSQLKQANEILGIDDTDFEYENYFSAKDVAHKNRAELHYKNAFWKLKKWNDLFKTVKNKEDKVNIITNLQAQKELSRILYDLFDELAQGFEDSLETGSFSSSVISGYSSTFSGLRSSAQSQITDITNTIDTLETYDSIEKITQDHVRDWESQKNAIESLKLNIKNIGDDQDFLVNTAAYNIDGEKLKEEKSRIELEKQVDDMEQFEKNQIEEKKQVEAALSKLKLELITLEDTRDELVNLSSNQEYVFLKNDVKQNEVSLKDAKKNLENYSLEAPFDGIVTKIDIAKGDRLNADTEKFISIVDPNTIEVKSFVGQTDIVKLSWGMPAMMKIDAYSDESFSGSISEIETTPTDQGWISKFEIKVQLENPKDLKLYSGMKVDMQIPIKDLGEVIVVPFIAVSTDDTTGEKFVTKVLESGETQKQVVTLWYTDGEYYEILSWLAEGDSIYEIDFNPDLFKTDSFFGDEEDFEEDF